MPGVGMASGGSGLAVDTSLRVCRVILGLAGIVNDKDVLWVGYL